MALPKIELNLSEDNELGFTLKIEGSASDIGNSKPKIRFALTEKKSGRGWLFNTEKSEDDCIAVTIPAMKGMISESAEYSGKLEVILGEHYFTPTVMDIKFIEPLKVEAAIVTRKSSKENKGLLEEVRLAEEEEQKDAQALVVESQIQSVITKTSPVKKEETVKKEPSDLIVKENVAKRLSYSDLDQSQKLEVNKIFVEKCRQLDPENFKNSKDVMHYMKEGTDFTKKRLQALVAKSVEEYLNKD